MERIKTDEELKQIAKDLYAGRIFSDRHVPIPRDIIIVFALRLFEDIGIREKMISKEIFFIYEYMDKASPRSLNGMPMFTSFHSLNEIDFHRMVKFHDKIVKAMDEI